MRTTHTTSAKKLGYPLASEGRGGVMARPRRRCGLCSRTVYEYNWPRHRRSHSKQKGE
jgi:hypothetical protein